MMTTVRDLRKKLRFARSFLLGRLVHVNLQILYACNYRCTICDFWKHHAGDGPSAPAPRVSPPPAANLPTAAPDRLSAAQAATIGAALDRLGPQIISIGGGEPMLHPELPGIVSALARNHFPVMITNGSLVTGDRARELWKQGMVEISVSVDYADAARHDRQRGRPGAHAQALVALEILHATRTRPEQRVNMISVIMDDNIEEVEPLIRWCEHAGITYLVTLYSHSRGQKPTRHSPADVGQSLLELKRRYRHFVALRGYLGRFTEAVAAKGIGPCSAGRNLWNIDTRGNVGFCIDRLEETVGNIFTDPVHQLEQRARERQRQNRCRDCWTSCRGSIEAARYGTQRLANLLDYYQMTRPIPLGRKF